MCCVLEGVASLSSTNNMPSPTNNLCVCAFFVGPNPELEDYYSKIVSLCHRNWGAQFNQIPRCMRCTLAPRHNICTELDSNDQSNSLDTNRTPIYLQIDFKGAWRIECASYIWMRESAEGSAVKPMPHEITRIRTRNRWHKHLFGIVIS